MEHVNGSAEENVLLALLPDTLSKAAHDNWYVLLETVRGQQFLFGSVDATVTGWVKLLELDKDYNPDMASCFPKGLWKNPIVVGERGVDIRLDEIAWVVDGAS